MPGTILVPHTYEGEIRSGQLGWPVLALNTGEVCTLVLFHYSSKYLAGHTDLIGGCLSYSTAELGEKLRNMHVLMGPSMVSTVSTTSAAISAVN